MVNGSVASRVFVSIDRLPAAEPSPQPLSHWERGLQADPASMNRIDARFAQLKAAGRKALVPFITAGDPSLEATVPVMHALVAAGADVIELGVPFSDPMADGPTIQRSSERALARGAGLGYVLDSVRAFRGQDADTPVVLMGYLNPIEIRGADRFAREAADAGVDGVLLVDLPPEEAAEFREAFDAAGIALILLASPTTSDARVGQLCDLAAGYLYYVSFAGVTGADRLDTGAAGDRLAAIRARKRGAGRRRLRHQGRRQRRGHGPAGRRRRGRQRAGRRAGRSRWRRRGGAPGGRVPWPAARGAGCRLSRSAGSRYRRCGRRAGRHAFSTALNCPAARWPDRVTYRRPGFPIKGSDCGRCGRGADMAARRPKAAAEPRDSENPPG